MIFKMKDAKPVSAPLALHFRLLVEKTLAINVENRYMERVPYASAVKSLMYVMVCTLLNLA